MADDILLVKDKGAYLVLDLTARLIAKRTREELEGTTLGEFADLILTDPFGQYYPMDSDRWFELFEAAMQQDYMLYCILMVTRFAGTKIVDGGAYWKMEPIMQADMREAWWTLRKWQHYRWDVLMPYKDVLRELMLKNGR